MTSKNDLTQHNIGDLMNEASSQKSSVPALINLPIRRETYIDQNTADQILTKLWDEAPELIEELAGQERLLEPHQRDSYYDNASYHIEKWLRDNVIEQLDANKINIAVVDLLHETSRRIRSELKLSDVAVLGTPLRSGPDAPLPELVSIDVLEFSDDEVTKESADTICAIAYNRNPTLMDEICEQQRHQVRSFGIGEELHKLMNEIREEHSMEHINDFSLELKRRLNTMCSSFRSPPKNEMRGP